MRLPTLAFSAWITAIAVAAGCATGVSDPGADPPPDESGGSGKTRSAVLRTLLWLPARGGARATRTPGGPPAAGKLRHEPPHLDLSGGLRLRGRRRRARLLPRPDRAAPGGRSGRSADRRLD